MNTPKKKILNLFLGIAFLGYGSYRLFSFYKGAEYSNFRIVIAVGFVILGALDIYKFFNPSPKN